MRTIILKIFIPFVLLAQQERWVYRYDGSAHGEDMALSIAYSNENIYATGFYTGTDQDILVLNLQNSGQEKWIYTYSGSMEDVANSITVDVNGNVYIAGYTRLEDEVLHGIIISLNPNGQERWKYILPDASEASPIIYGQDGNIYTGGIYNEMFMVASFNSLGSLRWIYANPSDQGRCFSITYGLDGNIYATGYRYSTGGAREDIFVVSLNSSSGQERWRYVYNGPSQNIPLDEGYHIVYGLDGNIYVTGRSHSENYADLIVISLKNDGNLNWIYRYDGPAHGWDWGNEIIYNMDGNIYVTGCSSDPTFSFIVLSLKTDGSQRWIHRVEDGDVGFSITNDQIGNIYAAGRSKGGIYGDIMALSLSPSGEVRWRYRYNGPANYYDDSRKIIYGQDGNLYIAGFSTGNGTNLDFTIISLFSEPMGEYDMSPRNKDKDSLKKDVNIRPISTFFNEKIFIKFLDFHKSTLKIILYNSLGEKIFCKTCPFTFSFEINGLGKISKGVYFLKIYSNKKEIGNFKLIKK